MSQPFIQDDEESIDQVIQSGQLSSHSQVAPRNLSNPNINKTTSSVSKGSDNLRRREHDIIGHLSAPLEDRRGGSQGGDGNGKSRSAWESETGSSRSERTMSTARGTANMTDFFSSEVFNIVLHNPTTAHRFLRFCQSRACGENIEFLQKVRAQLNHVVGCLETHDCHCPGQRRLRADADLRQQVDKYNRLLDEVSQLLGSIHSTYTSPDAPRQINISHSHIKHVSAEIKMATTSTIPALEAIFGGAQDHVEKLLAGDIYPRFVKHQVTAQASLALADHRDKFQGLGDCFCLTDPNIADNPILFASDGFVSVTYVKPYFSSDI